MTFGINGPATSSVEISEVVGIGDRLAHRLAERGQYARQSLDMAAAVYRLRRVLAERRPLCRHPRRSLGHAPELHHTFGNVIDVVFHVFVDFVEQLVESDEIGPLDVPMGLLGLRLQVDGIREPSIEQLDRLGANVLGKVAFRFEHFQSPEPLPIGRVASGVALSVAA